MLVFILVASVVGIIGLGLRKYFQNGEASVVGGGISFERPSTPSFSDVCIVGAGPAGSTCAYFLRQSNIDVTILERKKFPRDKYCGDAWCSSALDILEEMGVLQELQRKGLVREVARGGFVSPFGYSCVGGPYGSVSKCRTFAIKRMICDEAIAMRAREVGANLIEETEVFSCNFDANRGFWTLKTSDKRIFCCRMLVLADGSNSRLAHTLNIVTEQPTAICTRHYIESDTHDCTDDGVMFYTPSVLPGYSAIFRHYNNDLYLGTYLLPGSKVEHRHLSRLEAEIVTSYDPVRKALGKSFKWKDLMKTAPLRIGGVDKSYADNLIIVGDAAGQVDPMTGEGIHTAMVAAKIAANLIQEMFLSDNFSSQNCAIYHQRWMKNFGSDFVYSKWIAKAVVYFPFIMDALCVVGIRRGQAFLDEFGLIMTGVKPKLEFLRPKYVFPIGVEIIRQIFIQKILRRPPITPDYARSVLRRNKKARN